MKPHFSLIQSEFKLAKRISPMRAHIPAEYGKFSGNPPFQHITQKQDKKIRSSSTDTSLFLMSAEPKKKLPLSSKSILSPNHKSSESKSKLLFNHKTILLDVYKDEDDDKSDIFKANSNRQFKRKLVDFEYKQRRLSCSCTECGIQSKKQRKLLHAVPKISQFSATNLFSKLKTQPSVMIKSTKSIISSTTKISYAELSNQKSSKQLVNSLSPQKQLLLKKGDVSDKQLPAINKSSILIEFQRRKTNFNNFVETSLTSPKTMPRNSAPNLERYESPNHSTNLNIKINYLNQQESYKNQTDRLPNEFIKLRTENNLKNYSQRQKGKNVIDCYLKMSLHRKLGAGSNILLKTFGK